MKLTTDGYEASCGLFATAELLVLTSNIQDHVFYRCVLVKLIN